MDKKTAAASVRALANNLPANAENCVAAGHGPKMWENMRFVKSIAPN
jgi:hypothetical protein